MTMSGIIWPCDLPERSGIGEQAMSPVVPMAANAIDDILGIRIKRIQKTKKKAKEKLYRGVNQGYQRAI